MHAANLYLKHTIVSRAAFSVPRLCCNLGSAQKTWASIPNVSSPAQSHIPFTETTQLPSSNYSPYSQESKLHTIRFLSECKVDFITFYAIFIAQISEMLSVFFWVFPRRLIVVCRRLGTLYQFHLQGLDVKYEVLEVLYIQPLKMELIECSETSTNHNRTPGKYPKEYRQDSKHGESLKSRIRNVTYRDAGRGHNVHRRTWSAVEEEQHLHAIHP